MVERLFAFIARHPRSFDAFVMVVWLLITLSDSGLGDEENSLTLLLPSFIAASLVLYWRRRHPLYVFGLQALIVVMLTIVDIDSPVPGALICGTYSVAAHVHERRFSIAAFVAFTITGFAAVLFGGPEFIPDTLLVVLLLTVAWVIGDSLRTRRAYQQSVLERAERAEALRDSLAHQAVAEERTRIARDLHDVVAHSMSLMVVQAGAARRIAAADTDAAITALEAIESVGRNSLDEMRRILGVLRADDHTRTTTPQPDIAALDPMIDEFVAAGLPITVSRTGEQRPLSPGVELTAFRIVQESLTNTLKHAGPARATVTLNYGKNELGILVEDDGRGVATAHLSDAPGSRTGHIGMRERVAAFDGALTVRPRADGGYQVAATIPLHDIRRGEQVTS